MEYQKAKQLYKERINILLNVAQTINEEHSVDELLAEFRNLLTKELGIGKIMVFLLSKGQWYEALTAGIDTFIYDNISVKKDLADCDDITPLALNENPNLREFDYAIPLYHKQKLISYVLIGESDILAGVSSSIRELKFIQIIANIIIVFIENKKLQEKLIKQSYLQSELDLAKSIQSSLVPKEEDLLSTPHAKIRTVYQPFQQVGGDYYDVIQLANSSFGFCMADVSGKGIAAALLMSNFQALTRALFSDDLSMERFIRILNEKVYQNSSNDKFITAFFGKYEPETSTLYYVNAAHLPALVYDPTTKEIHELVQGCIGLGMLDELPGVQVGRMHISQRSRLIVFTDGLIEIDEGNQVDSQMNALRTILRTTNNIASVMLRIAAMADDNREGGLTFDDVTALGIEFFPESPKGNLLSETQRSKN